ncbi:segregation and condensation protein A [Cellulomonas marina]|uniref:Segregation and condensation protein A n=1 Tax=Cellulomonas marina TaxID=988821 RepID=A0A1I0ZWK9_9CELL|nr:ScpA family protein [Cellulomonas marina]GIG29421.1 segregation/condensation protein A [Cellulomonas marina]SFB30109.1 condensin subunit ScpA [Cellulomonas marina]
MATPPEATVRPGPAADAPAGGTGFAVRLDNFEGPFDLLLGLIARHKLDITEVALARVTDDFIAHLRARESAGDWDLGQVSEFLLVAATLLDLKAARLLPSAEIEDAEDLELLEARDLLFARLLQYRAYKQVAADLEERLLRESRRFPRQVALEPQLAALLPELVLSIGPEQLAALAARALAPRPAPPGVDLAHLHAPPVSVREQADVLVARLRRSGSASFRTLVGDADGTLVVVARFLALLELFREGAVAFEQVQPLGELTVRWTGSAAGGVRVAGDFDAEDLAPRAGGEGPA